MTVTELMALCFCFVLEAPLLNPVQAQEWRSACEKTTDLDLDSVPV